MSFTTIEVIKTALRHINVLDASQPLQSTDRNDTLKALNSMLSSWLTQYSHLWLQTFATVLMERGKQSYLFGTDRIIDDGELLSTTITNDAAAADTVITLASVSGLAASDNIGIYLSSGSFHWTTVASISGLDVTITDAMPSAATSGAQVYAYTAVANRALRINNVTYIDRIVNGGEIPLEQWSRKEYTDQPQKNSQGSASAFYYSPQLNNGILYVWPVAQSNLNVLRVDYTRAFTTLVNNDDLVDLPDEWQDAVEWGLAAKVCVQFGVTPDRAQAIKAQADELLANCLAWDNESAGMQVDPSWKF